MRRFLVLVVTWGVLFCPCLSQRGDAAPESEARDITRQYNRVLKDYFPDVKSLDAPLNTWQVTNLINLVCRLLSVPITDPSTLQGLDFTASYEILFELGKKPDPEKIDLFTQWKRFLVELDIKAQKINKSEERPSARWVVEKGKSLPDAPSARMLNGYIEREENTVYISKDGRVCGESKSGCEKIRYVLIKCLVPGIEDPERARALLHAFPPEKSDSRVVDYWEVLLDPEKKLMRRNYGIRPFSGYSGTMEDYHQIAYEDKERIVVLEQNARGGKFIRRTDNAGVYVRSPPHGVTVAMIFSGKYIMEKFFYALIGDKLLREPVEVMAILRQFILHPEKGADSAVEAGQRDYLENQGAE